MPLKKISRTLEYTFQFHFRQTLSCGSPIKKSFLFVCKTWSKTLDLSLFVVLTYCAYAMPMHLLENSENGQLVVAIYRILPWKENNDLFVFDYMTVIKYHSYLEL